jgi:cytochrome c oxidase subunit 2
MKRSQYLSLLPFVGLALAIIFLPVSIPLRPVKGSRVAEPVVHQIAMTADQFAYDPPVLRVNRGDRVQLTLQAADVVHGFYLDGYGLEVRLEPGLSQRVEFVADQVGKFRYRCSVSCGTLHPFMIGELIVAPNLVFARAVGLMLVALGATLFYLRRFPVVEGENPPHPNADKPQL